MIRSFVCLLLLCCCWRDNVFSEFSNTHWIIKMIWSHRKRNMFCTSDIWIYRRNLLRIYSYKHGHLLTLAFNRTKLEADRIKYLIFGYFDMFLIFFSHTKFVKLCWTIVNYTQTRFAIAVSFSFVFGFKWMPSAANFLKYGYAVCLNLHRFHIPLILFDWKQKFMRHDLHGFFSLRIFSTSFRQITKIENCLILFIFDRSL